MALSHHTFCLPNGLRLVVTPMPGRYSVTVAVFLGVGSRYEDDKRAGSSHLLEHMLFKGTVRRPTAESISETIESVGGSMNASTDKEVTLFWAKVSCDEIALAIDLLADMLQHSLIDATEVRKEKRVVGEELGMIMDSPQDQIHTLIEETIWPGHALGRDVAGTRESVARLTRAGLLRFRDAHYTPRSTVVSVAGDVEPGRVRELVEEGFGSWSGQPAPPYLPGAYPADRPRVALVRRDTEQANLCLAVRGLSHHDPRRYALDLLNSILGGSMSSRLFVEVRERRGLVYDIHSYTDRLDDTGVLVVYAGMDPGAGPVVAREILDALRRLRDEPVSDHDLARAKSQYRGRLLLGLEDTSSVASWCGAQQLLLKQISTVDSILEEVNAVTAGDLQALAGELFRDEYLRLAVIGPYDDDRLFSELLHLA